MTKAKPFVTGVLQLESKTRWPQPGLETKRAGGKSDGVQDPDLELEEDQVLEHLWESLLNHPDSHQFEPGIVQLLVDQAKATLLMKRFPVFPLQCIRGTGRMEFESVGGDSEDLSDLRLVECKIRGI